MTWRAALLWQGILLAQIPFANYATEAVWETEIGPIPRGGRHLASVCPSGMTVVHDGNRDVVVVDALGTIVARRSSIEGLRDSTASTCDSGNRLFTAANGKIRLFDVSAEGELGLRNEFYASGVAYRLTVARDVLYVLGYARVAGTPTILRRFRWQEGRLLGTLTVDQPIHAGPGNTINSFLMLGSLTVLPAASGLLYVPANPLEFRTFDAGGTQVRLRRPAVPHFESVDSATRLNAPDWKSVDWAYNTVALRDGRIVVHVVKRGSLPGEPSTSAYSHLKVFSSDFDLLADNIRTGNDRFPGLLIGADGNEDLYFARLSVPRGGAIRKVRLVKR